MTSLALIQKLQQRADHNKLGKAGREELWFQRQQQFFAAGAGVTPSQGYRDGYRTGPLWARTRPTPEYRGSGLPRPNGPAHNAAFRPPGHAQFAELAGFTGMGAEPKGTPIKKQSTAQVRKIVKQLSTKEHLTQTQAKRLERAGQVLLNRAENKRQADIILAKANDAVALKKAQDAADAAERARRLAALQQQSAQVDAAATAGATLPTGAPAPVPVSGGGGSPVSDAYLFGEGDDFSGGSALAPTSAAAPTALSPPAVTAADGTASSGPSKGLLIAGAVALGLFLFMKGRRR